MVSVRKGADFFLPVPMIYAQRYASPLGEMLLACDEAGLVGVWFEGQRYYPEIASFQFVSRPILSQTVEWLDNYFKGLKSACLPPLHLRGSEFQLQVWSLLSEIPYGERVSYSELGRKLAAQRGLSSMSAQAVGGAVGHNPISILIPCHRVVGANGSLTGYAGGLDRKEWLLRWESGELFLEK